MKFFKNIFGTIDKAIDKIPTDQNRELIRAEISKELAKLESEFDLELQKELTKRYDADLYSSSWLNRNIRAIILLIYTALLIVLPFIEAVPPHIIDLYSTCAMLVYGFYFGGKSFEKSISLLSEIKMGVKK